jgi:hypothetical protein
MSTPAKGRNGVTLCAILSFLLIGITIVPGLPAP